MAAGIGVDLPVTEPRGTLIVDIGGGTTEIAVSRSPARCTATSLRVAGDEMDEAIVTHMRKARNLLVGEQTAELIKFELGSALPLETPLSLEVKGRHVSEACPAR